MEKTELEMAMEQIALLTNELETLKKAIPVKAIPVTRQAIVANAIVAIVSTGVKTVDFDTVVKHCTGFGFDNKREIKTILSQQKDSYPIHSGKSNILFVIPKNV